LILYLTPSKAISSMVSESLQIVDILPNYTLGGFFGAFYHTDIETGSRPLLEFDIIPALTRWKEKRGFYLNPPDLGARPELTWEKKRNVISLVGRNGFSPYISLTIMPITPGLPLRFHLSFIEVKGEGIILPKILPVTKMALSLSSIHIPPSSPLSGLPFKGKVLAITFSLDQVMVGEPRLVKRNILEELKTGVYGRIPTVNGERFTVNRGGFSGVSK